MWRYERNSQRWPLRIGGALGHRQPSSGYALTQAGPDSRVAAPLALSYTDQKDAELPKHAICDNAFVMGLAPHGEERVVANKEPALPSSTKGPCPPTVVFLPRPSGRDRSDFDDIHPSL